MDEHRHEIRPRRRGTSPTASVLVCRGCCCGTTRKHPEIDHDAHLQAIRDAAGPGVHVRTVGCLGPCSSSNVVVVRPMGAHRKEWFGQVNDGQALGVLTQWIGDGCSLPLPASVGALRIEQTPVETAPAAAEADDVDAERVVVAGPRSTR